jgi:MraZ protein
VPARIRAAFSGGLVLAQDVEPCVTIWTPDEFERWTQSFLADLNPLSPERRKLTRYFAGTSFDAELDSAGRVILNQALLEHAGIDKEVVIVGNYNSIEVWSRETWRAYESELDSTASETAQRLAGQQMNA